MARDSNEVAVQKQVALLRDGYDIGIYPEYIPLMCNECDEENLKFSNNFLVNFFPLPISTTIDWSSFLFPRFHRNLLNGLTQVFSLTIHLLYQENFQKHESGHIFSQA